MTRWIIWSALLISTAGASTLASRARNTPSLIFHAFASVLSHGTFFAGQLIGIDLIVEVVQTQSWTLAVTGFLVYTSSSTTGSVLSHWMSMRFFEKGDRRVGSYRGER